MKPRVASLSLHLVIFIAVAGRMFTDDSCRLSWDFLDQTIGHRLITAHPGQDWPLYIERYLGGSARLRNLATALKTGL